MTQAHGILPGMTSKSDSVQETVLDTSIPPFLALPTEIKSRIATSLRSADARSLALTHSSLIDIGEAVSWQLYELSCPPRGISTKSNEATTTTSAAAEPPVNPNVLAWQDFERSLLARPVRYSHIQALWYTIHPLAIPIAARILPKLSCLIELGEREMPSDHASLVDRHAPNTSYRLLEECGPLSPVEMVDLRAANASPRDLFRGLHNLPNLAILCANVTAATRGGEPQVQPPDLPHLETLHLTARFWSKRLCPIVSRAPRLATVALADHGRVPERPKRSDSLDAFFRLESIRQLDLGQAMWSYLLKANRRILGWLPSLETLHAPCAPNESCIPRHPKLSLLKLTEWKGGEVVPLGSAPNSDGGTSGLLDEWVEDGLDRAPSLICIDDYIGEDDDGDDLDSLTDMQRATVTGWRFTTFTNGDEVLYHARKNVRYLSPATLMYYDGWVEQEQIPYSMRFLDDFMDMDDDSWGSEEYDFDPADFLELTDAEGAKTIEDKAELRAFRAMMDDIGAMCDTADSASPGDARADEPIGTDTEEMREYTLELTVYGNWPLPYALLDYVYEQAACEREWKEGQRGLKLPDHVWQYLRDWNREVCMTPKGFGQPQMLMD